MPILKASYSVMNIGFIPLFPEVAKGAGHHSVIQVPGKDEYYIVYHRRPLDRTGGSERQVCIDKLEFDKDGFIKPVKMTFEGVSSPR